VIILFGCQQVLIHTDKDTQAIIEYLCNESNKVFNCAVYYARQVYFKAHRYATKTEESYTSKTSLMVIIFLNMVKNPTTGSHQESE